MTAIQCNRCLADLCSFIVQDLQFVSQDGAVQPQSTPVASTFSTVLPFCPSEHTAPMAFKDSPPVYTNPPLSEQKAPAGPASSSDPAISPQPVRKVSARRQLKYSELASTESDPRLHTSPGKAKCNEEQALGSHCLRPRTASEKELQVHEDEEFSDAELHSGNRRSKHHNPWSVTTPGMSHIHSRPCFIAVIACKNVLVGHQGHPKRYQCMSQDAGGDFDPNPRGGGLWRGQVG